MVEVGMFEAKSRLSALVEHVRGGQEVVITRHGNPVARLVPYQTEDEARVHAAVDGLLTVRRGCLLGDTDWKTLRDAGRR